MNTCDHILETVRNIIANGDSQIFNRCEICHQRVGPALRHEEYDIERVPVLEDWSKTRPPCVRCGAWGVEIHHFAPRALFGRDEAELWPTAHLCRPCHVKWHQIMDGVAS